jgi:DNA-binding HxlR family transcriptional regulator
MSYLVNIEWADFKRLMEVTAASKGNLSVQISKLQEVGYLEVKKSFKANYPHTECRVTPKGKAAFDSYLKDLKKLLKI